MIETPQIVETAAQTTAVIHVVVPREEIRDAMGPGIDELRATLAAQGIGPSGPWYTRHLRWDPEVFDFEIGLPVTTPILPTGRVEPGQLPAATVARTVYCGGYAGLPGAWGEFDAWIAAQGYTPGPELWERYLVGPETTSNPAEWRTELNRPLDGRS